MEASWQVQTLEWLNSQEPWAVHLATILLMALEGMGIPGIPGALPMAAEAAMISSGRTSYLEASLIGSAANFAGSVLGYHLGARGLQLLPARWRHFIAEGGKRLDRHAGPTIALSRSIGMLRTPVTWGAAVAGYPALKFAGWSIPGALLHVFAWQYILLRGSNTLLHGSARDLLLGALSLLAAGGLLTWHRRRRSVKDSMHNESDENDQAEHGHGYPDRPLPRR